jgi:hypothetical protein
MCFFECCCKGLKKLWLYGPNSAVRNKQVSTPVIQFHPISEQERLFAKKLLNAVSSQAFLHKDVFGERLKLSDVYDDDESRYHIHFSLITN